MDFGSFRIGFDERDRTRLHELWDEVLESQRWTEGPLVDRFEQAWQGWNLLPAVAFSGWTGAATAVRVKFVAKTTKVSTLTVWNAAGTAQLGLANPLNLGGSYVPSAGAVFNATMVQNGAAITVTLGSLASGSVQATAATGGTVTWTPSNTATDLAGNKCSTASVSTPGPAL